MVNSFHLSNKEKISALKPKIIEEALRSIMFDIERLTETEREIFYFKYGSLLEYIS